MLTTKYYNQIISGVFLAIVMLIFTYSMLQLRYRYCSNVVEKYKKSLKEISSQIKTLREKHNRILQKIKDFPGLINESYALSRLNLEVNGPSEEYERMRRRVHANTKELWYTVRNYFMKAFIYGGLTDEDVKTILQEAAERKRLLLSDQERQTALDGYDKWRRREAAIVGDLVQRRLHYLQNPSDCRAARKLICNHDAYGFGCNLHRLVYCLVTAYALRRTLIVENYSDYHTMHDWKYIFSPLSKTCLHSYSQKTFLIKDKTLNETVIFLPLMRYYSLSNLQPKFMPKDIGQRIHRFNSDPYSWWIGQMVKYVFRFRKPEVLDAIIAKINWTLPIVGVHIRRTDKLLAEAKYYALDEYMYHVEDYYAQLELTRPINERRVYLATDDATVLKEAIERYPQYTFYGDYVKAQIAAVRYRVSRQGFSGLLIDLYMLSLTDFVVCTFSSNIGRMAYELMQTKRIDAPNRFVSLDHSYYFTYGEKSSRTAVMRNKKVPLNVGDKIMYNRLTQSDIGVVVRTNYVGHVPWHKTEEDLLLAAFPEYKEVPLYTQSANNYLCKTNQTCTYK